MTFSFSMFQIRCLALSSRLKLSNKWIHAMPYNKSLKPSSKMSYLPVIMMELNIQGYPKSPVFDLSPLLDSAVVDLECLRIK